MSLGLASAVQEGSQAAFQNVLAFQQSRRQERESRETSGLRERQVSTQERSAASKRRQEAISNLKQLNDIAQPFLQQVSQFAPDKVKEISRSFEDIGREDAEILGMEDIGYFSPRKGKVNLGGQNVVIPQKVKDSFEQESGIKLDEGAIGTWSVRPGGGFDVNVTGEKDPNQLGRFKFVNGIIFDTVTSKERKSSFFKDIAKKSGKRPSASEFKVADFTNRMELAESIFDDLSEEGADLTVGTGPVGKKVPEKLKSQNRKRLEQAKLAFANAVLRKESGAAVPETEVKRKATELFPIISDGPKVIAAKKLQRDTLIKNFRNEAGEAYVPLESEELVEAEPVPTAPQRPQGIPSKFQVGQIVTLKDGSQAEFLGGDDNDSNSWRVL